MNVLALETATEACSVAVLTPAGCCERHVVIPRGHTDVLLDLVGQVLAEAGLARSAIDVVAFGNGPGAFTGVRIAAAAAQGIACAHDLPLAPVSTLAALAAGGARLAGAGRYLAAIDARRHEVYAAGWEFAGGSDHHGRCVMADCLAAPAALLVPQADTWHAVGNAWSVYRGEFAPDLAALQALDLLHPHAQDVARLGAALHARGASVSAGAALPVYLRGALD